MRTLLFVTTATAIFFAITSPILREMTASAWKNVATLWISALFFASIGAWFLAYKTRRFEARQPRDYLVYLVMKDRHWMAIGVTLVMLLGISVGFYSIGSLDRDWDWMMVVFGTQAGIPMSLMLRQTKIYFILNDDGVLSNSGCTPWKNVHGVVQGDAENVIGLKLLAGEIKFFVPPKQREEILAYLEEKTVRKLSE